MKPIHALVLVAALVCGGCALERTFAKCGLSGCPGDAQINARVVALISQHADVFLGDINVQTLDRVVYLYGLIDTDVQRAEVVEAAQQIAGADHVVDSMVLRNDPAF